MIGPFSRFLIRLGTWLSAGSRPPFPLGGGASGLASLAGARSRPASASELLGELRATAWVCATLNASACASFPPRLYVATRSGQARARCLTRALSPCHRRTLFDRPDLAPRLKGVEQVEEVTE